jgi:hypothetical protein
MLAIPMKQILLGIACPFGMAALLLASSATLEGSLLLSETFLNRHKPQESKMQKMICKFALKAASLVGFAQLAFGAAFGQEAAPTITLLPGHPIHHESEAGVAMALRITPSYDTTSLTKVCEELRAAAGLNHENGDQLRLQVIFVVPYKGMAIEGYYWPNDGKIEGRTLVPGNTIPSETLGRIIARAGIPPRILDEIDVQHEISCETAAPLWLVAWYDVRAVGEEDPGAVIKRAYRRFMAVHQSVIQHNAQEPNIQIGQQLSPGG